MKQESINSCWREKNIYSPYGDKVILQLEFDKLILITTKLMRIVINENKLHKTKLKNYRALCVKHFIVHTNM